MQLRNCRAVMEQLAAGRNFGFPLERALADAKPMVALVIPRARARGAENG